jgi:hypothetical protein
MGATIFGFQQIQQRFAQATATAHAHTTATAQAQATATKHAEEIATAWALMTATAQAQATATAQVQATITEQALATVRAEVYAVATGRAKTATAEATRTIAAATPTTIVKAIYGPVSGKLDHREDDSIESRDAGVNLRDFIAEVRFYNPYERSERGWDYGFGFRSTGGNQNYRLSVDSDGNWVLTLVTKEGDKPKFDRVSQGKVKNMDLAANGFNNLRLVAEGNVASFFVNGEYIATINISAKTVAGNVWIGTGFFANHEINGRSTRYEGFTVWSLP